MKLALQYRGVVKRYGRRRALDGLNLEVPRGAILGLVGSNGAGKTTTLTSAAGLLRIHGGAIDVLGDGPFNPAIHTGRVSLLPQDALFPGHTRVRELLLFYGRLQRVPALTLPGMVDEVLEWVHLSDRQDSKIRTLSHGMRRRLALAQAFLGQPDLILLDEPLNGLDPHEVVNARGLIRQRRETTTMVISSHMLSEIEVLCDHVAFVEQGRTVRQDVLANVTGTHRMVRIEIGAGEPPLEHLQARLAGADVTFDAATRILTVGFAAEQFTAASVNRGALSVLLKHEVEILSVQRGSDLEREYLAARDARGTPHR